MLRVARFAVLLLVIVPVLWLVFDHAPKQVEFVDKFGGLQAFIWSKQAEKLSGATLLFQGEEMILKPSSRFYVSEQGWYSVPPEQSGLPILLQMRVTPAMAKRLSGTFVSAHEVVLKSAKPINAELLARGYLSLKFSFSRQAGTLTSLLFALENPSEKERIVFVNPTQPSQQLVISIDGNEPIDGELLFAGQQDATEVTVSLRGSDEIHSNTSSWAGLSIFLLGQPSLTFYQIERHSGGRFEFFDPNGHLTMADRSPVPIMSSYLGIDFVDVVNISLSEGTSSVTGEAGVVRSATASQMLPSRWDDLTVLQQILTGVVSGLLVAGLTYLVRKVLKA